MKAKIFTLIFISFLMVSFNLNAQLNMGTGVSWGELGASEPLLLSENFQGFSHFHSDSTTDMGNSNNAFDTDGFTIIYGYKNDTVEVPIIGSSSGKIKYYFYQCAFAPNWKPAWSFRDLAENTPNVSDGFVEISRTYASNPPTVHGSFIVDLRAIEFVEVIQWTHSSCGGNKRGVMLEFSQDDGTTWDTLRYQPGNTWSLSFTKDVLSGAKTPNGYRCDPSAYGMTWEDGIFAGNIMLRFSECGGQVPRIHDLKVYGTFTPRTSALDFDSSELKINSLNRKIQISEPADVAIYSITGNLIKKLKNTDVVSMDEVPAGVYLVNARAGKRVCQTKIIIQ